MAVVQNPQANRDALRRMEEERLRLAAMVASGRVASGRTVEETLTMPKSASDSYQKYLGQHRSIMGGGKNDIASIQKAREDAYYARNYIQNNREIYDTERGPGAAQSMLDYIERSLNDIGAFEGRRLKNEIGEQRDESAWLYESDQRRKQAAQKKMMPTLQAPYRGPIRKQIDPEVMDLAVRKLMDGPAVQDVDPYGSDRYRSAEDFDEKSKLGAQMENPNPAAFGQGFNVFGWKPFAQPVQNKVQYAKENADFLRMAALQGSNDPEMAYVKYAYLTDDETNLYNYLLAEHGEEEADRYLSEMDRELDRREAETFTQGAAEFASTNPVAANLLSAAASPLTGAGYAKNAFTEITGGAANPFDSSLGLSRISGAIRGRTAENISKGWAGDTGAFLYQTGMSLVDNLANMAMYSGLGNVATLASMGSGAAENSYIGALERGATSKQALGAGALTGAAEILFEKISLDNFIKLANGGGAGTFVMNVLKQMGIEASEETATEIANTITDTLVMGELSNYNLSVQRYMAEGKTEEEAQKQARLDVAKNVGLSALGGGLSGGVMGAGGGAIGAFRDSHAQNELQDTSPRVDTALEEDGLVDDPLRQAADNAAGVAAPLQELQTEPVLPPEASRQGAADELDDTPKTEAKPPNMQEQQLGVVAKTLDPKTAQAYRSNYEGDMPVSQYSEGFMSVYGAAKQGLGFESSAAQSKYPISPVAAMAAFNAGQRAAESAQVGDRADLRENPSASVAQIQNAAEETHGSFAQQVTQAISGFGEFVDGGVKFEASMAEKVDRKRKGGDADYTAQGMKDHVRGAVLLKNGLTDTQAVVKALKKQFPTLRGEAFLEQPLNKTGYRGIHLSVTYENGVNGEIQLSTPEAWAIKKQTDAIYEKWRNVDDKSLTAEQQAQYERDRAKSNFLWQQYYEGLTPEVIRKASSSVTGLESISSPNLPSKGSQVESLNSRALEHVPALQANKRRSSKSEKSNTESTSSEIIIAHGSEKTSTAGLRRRYTQEAMARLGGKEKQRTVRTQLRVLDAMAKEYGFAVDVVDTLGEQNAQYDPKTKRITIALDAQEGAYLHMAVHELTHYIRDNSGAEWEMFSDIVTDALLMQGVDVDALVQYQMKKNGLDADTALEEVVANGVPAILGDESVIKRIVQTDRTLAQRIADFFKDFVAKIRDIGARLGQSTSWSQMDWLQNDGKALQDITDQFFAALESAGEVQSGKGTGTSSRTGDLAVQTLFAGKQKESLHQPPSNRFNEPNSPTYKTPLAKALSTDSIAQSGQKGQESDIPKTRYSTKDLTSDDVRALVDENENYQKTIDLMQERYDLLRAEFKTTEGHRVRQKDVEQLAKRILKKERSSADEGKTARGLGEVFDYLASDTPQWEQLAAMGTSWAKGVLEKSIAVDQEGYRAMADVREALHDLRVSLSASQKAETTSRMGSDRAYRNALFGYVTIANDGIPLSSAWAELAERFPHVFSADSSEADMPMQLLDAVEASKPNHINPYEMSMDEAAYDLFLQVYDRYFDLPEIKTYADKQKAKLDMLRMQSRNAIERIRVESKERYERQLKALRKENIQKRQELAAKYQEAKQRNHQEDLAEYRTRYRALTDHKNQKLMEQRARFAEWRTMDSAKRKEREAVRKYRSRIEKSALEMTAWLERPSNKKHVPEALRESVVGFLESLNFDGNTKRAENLKNRLSAMARKLEKMDKGEYEGFYPVIDPDTIVTLDALSEQMKSTQSVYDMNGAQLKELSEAVISVRRAVLEANKLHAKNRYETVSAAGDAAIAHMESQQDMRVNGKIGEMVSGLLNADMLDSFAYFRRFGEAGEAMLSSLRDGFDRKVEHIREAQEYAQNAIADMDLKKLSGKKATKHTFALEGGKLEMTTAQIMELYLLNKRGQARGHMYGGGISLDEKAARVTKMTEADVRQVCDVLSEEQKALADKLQTFLAEGCAQWGNEASLTMYGYRKFTEKNYYPIRSNDNFTRTQDRQDEKGNLQRLQNLGMTKATVAGATNPLMISDVFDTFARHVQDMADYNAYAAPASDLMRWYNYRQKDGDAVKQEIERVYGRQGKQWLMNFVKDLNGVTEGRYGSGIVQSMMRNVKVAAVGANLRVVIQQPTAYARAFAEMDAKYLLKGLTRKPNTALAKKYCPIAQWKSWGYYETGLGKSLRETLVGDQSAMEAVREKSTALAGIADEVTWGALWNAAEAEVKDTHPALTPGTEAFYQVVGKRLSDVIDRTQVVDSVFHRTQIMRSKDGFAQLTTAFMSEPMKTYNMVRTAIAEAALGPGKETGARLGRVALTYAFTGALTAAAAAVADAFRDDDDEKEWMEKWRDAFGGNVLDNLNPLQMIPIARDALSLFEGYQPGRLDQQGLTRLVNVAKQQLKMLSGDSKWSDYKMFYEAVRAASDLTGIPLGSLMREFNTAYATITGAPIPMQHETASLDIAAQNLYEATHSGDTEAQERIRTKLHTEGDSPKNNAEIDAAIAKKLMENDDRIAQAWEAKISGNAVLVTRLRKEIIADDFTGEMVDKAIALYGATQEEKAAKDMEKELTVKLYKTEDLVAAARVAARTGNYQNMDLILTELIADSGATDPEGTVKSSARAALKADYMLAIEAGRTGEAERLGAVLKDRLGATDKIMEGWVQDDRRDRLRAAIEGEDTDTAMAVVYEMQDAGKKDSDIASSLKSTYQDAMYEAWSQGDDDLFFKYVDQLVALPLFNAKKKRIFTATGLVQWMRELREKEAKAERAG